MNVQDQERRRASSFCGVHSCFLIAGVLAIVALGSFRSLVSAYYVERGGRVVHRTAEGNLLDQESLPRAIADLKTALTWQEQNAQASRLLSEAYLLSGNPLEAVEALTEFLRERPGHPLGWWQLADIYWKLASDVEAAANVDLMASQPSAQEWDMPLADIHEDTVMSTGSGTVRRQVLAGARVEVTATVPATATTLIFWIGADPAARHLGGDGANVRVRVEDETVFSSHLTALDLKRGWLPGQTDIAAWSGRTVRIILEASAEMDGATSEAWLGWGDLQFVTPNQAHYAILDPGARAAGARKAGGFTALDLVEASRIAGKDDKHSEALAWARQAIEMDAGLSDAWYYKGLALGGLQRWDEALEAHHRAIEQDRFEKVGRGSVHYQTGLILQWHTTPPQEKEALHAYQLAIASAELNLAEKADAHYRRGQILWNAGGETSEFVAEYRKAIELNPNHTAAHMLLGVAYYFRLHNPEQAEVELAKAIDLDPQEKWAYYYWGEIYRYEADAARARTLYEQALQIDPEFNPAKERLQELNQED